MAQSATRIHILQALRAYAALPVVLFHTGYTIPGIQRVGIFGVHMFFLLSGYLLASICATDSHAFLRRRVIRIVPAYWLMTILLYCVAAVFPHWMSATQANPTELLKSLLFIPFLKASGLYQPVLFVGWTINYETLLYLSVAAGLFISKRRPLTIASAILLAVMGISTIFADKSGIAKFYSDPVILEFIFGFIAFYGIHAVSEETARRFKYAWASLTVFALVALPAIEGFGLFHASKVVQFGPLSFVLIVTACLLARGGNDIRYGVIALIGDASYTLYLVHPYIELAIDRVLARRIPIFHITTTFGCLFSVVVAVAVSIALYLKVEKPALSYLVKRYCRKPGETRPAFEIPAAPSQAGLYATPGRFSD